MNEARTKPALAESLSRRRDAARPRLAGSCGVRAAAEPGGERRPFSSLCLRSGVRARNTPCIMRACARHAHADEGTTGVRRGGTRDAHIPVSLPQSPPPVFPDQSLDFSHLELPMRRLQQLLRLLPGTARG